MENEVDKIAYPYGEKHVVREECSATVLIFSGLGLLRSDVKDATKPIIRSVRK
jgi:hypothetical protein